MAAPVKKYRCGTMEFARFENDGDKGVMVNYKLQKQYKDGDKWKDTPYYRRNELVQLRQLVDRVLQDEFNVKVEENEVPF